MFFFFFKQKTAYDIVSGDWSSDVCSSDLANHREQSARALAERYAIPRVTTDWRSLTEDDAIQAAIVATPNALHAEQSVAFLDAGKHVLVEKPMARTLAEAERMVEAADRSGARLM